MEGKNSSLKNTQLKDNNQEVEELTHDVEYLSSRPR